MCSEEDAEEYITVVAHPDPEDEEKDIWWAACNNCGTGYPIYGTDLSLSDEHNTRLIDSWISAHVCLEEPISDWFWLEEYGDINKHFGLDLDLL